MSKETLTFVGYRHYPDLDTIKRELNNKPLLCEVLFYTFVNHRATYSDIMKDVGVATGTEKEGTVRSALNTLMKRGYIEKTEDPPIYYNKVLVDDIEGIENYKAVGHYVNTRARMIKSETDYTPKNKEDMINALWVTRGTLLRLSQYYAKNNPQIAKELVNMLLLVRNTIKPDVEKDRLEYYGGGM